jgi:hypothetical protein
MLKWNWNKRSGSLRENGNMTMKLGLLWVSHDGIKRLWLQTLSQNNYTAARTFNLSKTIASWSCKFGGVQGREWFCINCFAWHCTWTETDSRLSYLDLEVNISDRRFTTAVFDKRDNFSFHIVNFPHMDSNIPSKPAYGVYISQLIRIGRICDSYESFFTRHHKLTCRLVKQGFLYDKLVTTFKTFCSRYPEILSKFKVSIKKHVQDGICLPTVAISSLSNKVNTRFR